MDVVTLAPPTMWVAFAAIVAIMLAIDLGIFHRKAHDVKPSEALIWTGIWVTLALVDTFNLVRGHQCFLNSPLNRVRERRRRPILQG